MLRIPFLRNILLISFVFATIFPIYELFYIIPSYQKLLINETEREATRFVHSLVISNSLEQFKLEPGSIPATLIDEVQHLKAAGQLVKLRVFSSRGEIIFSSDPQEIGSFNRKEYFKQIVVHGHVYSKMVEKASETAEGVKTTLDLVETYVPVMVADRFHGAMEVYYDISRAQKGLSSLARQSFMILLSVSSGLLLMTLLLLFRARNNIEARESAETALQVANEELEERVGRRTMELSNTNLLLSAEVSERKKAQQAQQTSFIAISEARDRIDAILSSVAEPLLVTDCQDSVVLINPAAESLFNVKAQEVVGCRLPDVIGFDSLLLEIAKARQKLRTARSIDFDFEMRSDGEKQVYRGRASRLQETDPRGGRGLVLLIHDVTHERQIDQMKSDFVSMTAHELKTPLTMILGYSELLLDSSREDEPQEQANFIKIINDTSLELSGLINDILDLSRIEGGQGLLLDFSQVDVAALCRKLLKDYERVNCRHRFVIEIAAGELIADVDAPRLSQVLKNLLDNALKYSAAGDLIRVVLKQQENWLRLDVIDHGIGMSEAEAAKAFERFYRGSASNAAVRGTGLGLSIAKYIVEGHGGEIKIFSSKGRGCRIEVRLPLTN